MLGMLGRNQEALQFYKKAIDLNSNNVSTWYKLGNLLSDAGDYDAAVKSYNEAVQLALGFEDVWYRLGELLTMQKDYKKAEECFSWILEINPNNVMAKKALLSLVKNKKNIQSEGPDLQRTYRKGAPKAKLRKIRRKRLKISKEKVEEEPIDKELKADIRRNEDELTIVSPSSLGDHIDQENAPQEKILSALYDEIYADLDELVSLLDQKSDHLNGECAEDNQHDEVCLDANSVGDTQLDGFLLDTQGVIDVLPDEELMDMHDVNDMVIDDVSVEKLIVVGKTHLKKKEFEKALGCFNRALELDPNQLDAWIAKGDVLLEMGKIPGASLYYKKGVVTHPNQINVMGNKETFKCGSPDIEFRDMLIHLLENIYEDFEESEGPNIDCPYCGSKVNINGKLCTGCKHIFLEEEFKNNINTKDNLVFFDKLKRILSAKIPTFLHLDDSNGVISFLEKRKNDKTGKFEYVLIRGAFKKFG